MKGNLTMALPTYILLDPDSVTGTEPDNPAIARCREAWLRRFNAGKAKGENSVLAGYYAKAAYREAMPALIDHESIRNFIACAAYGMLIDAIQFQHGSQLLYAAQVALTTLRAQSQPARLPGRPKKFTK
jgi:hypothetical protein